DVETARHELTHLFSGYVGKDTPALLVEGLAVFLQGTDNGEKVDFRALSCLLGSRWLSLATLKSDRVFYDHTGYSYPVAGSFARFLVKRHGWDGLLEFYRRVRRGRFDKVFRQVFGVEAEDAEREWRQNLLAKRHEFEPRLSRTIE